MPSLTKYFVDFWKERTFCFGCGILGGRWRMAGRRGEGVEGLTFNIFSHKE
jgi:hypothetical protein